MAPKPTADERRDNAVVDERLDNVIAFALPKGGTMRTTVASHVAAMLGSLERKVLVIDLDVNPAMGYDLGVLPMDPHQPPRVEGYDYGASIRKVFASEGATDFRVLPDVLPGVDLVPGGRHLKGLSEPLLKTVAYQEEGNEPALVFARKVADLADGYNVVIIDTPPGEGLMLTAGLTAARYVIAPVDPSSGPPALRAMLPLVNELQQGMNPRLTWLGMVLGKITPHHTRLTDEAVKALEPFIEAGIPLFDTRIRYAPGVEQARRQGRLVFDVARDYTELGGTSGIQRWLTYAENGNHSAAMPAGSATTVAGDYVALVTEIAKRISAHRSGKPYVDLRDQPEREVDLRGGTRRKEAR